MYSLFLAHSVHLNGLNGQCCVAKMPCVMWLVAAEDVPILVEIQ